MAETAGEGPGDILTGGGISGGAVGKIFEGNVALQYFDRMGLYRLLYSVEDKALLKELSTDILKPLTEYDAQHNAEYVDTLECYLNNGGSVKAVAEEMFIHRNTILYRMANIKDLLNCSLESSEDRMRFKIACMIRRMNMDDAVL